MCHHGDGWTHASVLHLVALTETFSMEPSDQMFMENLQGRHDFFLRARPYRGELPTMAGFLLYPDTPAKMETTSREAFCSRTVPQRRDRTSCRRNVSQYFCKYILYLLPGVRASGQQNLAPDTRLCSHPATPPQTASGHGRAAEPAQDPQAEKMLSQYQKDFPPPSWPRRRRTPALPQQDNIGINPSFRMEFRTVQRDTYPDWPVSGPETAGTRSSQSQ
ncbi:uncharacterized protein si:dkeyp-69c1.9 isoform X1 [Entelurus aequoreus]|uniref:uncharacterized protein si:dkeyp-69c1.9 isoform X1 n=1 Tax=Entelurus aequoreus TaxID=161455 RepID=UPI002B1E0839|nr:uncharacterized protein si:dkeyp-69c1.9 isoform X1 [Entelurus aequoreus]